MLHTKAHNLNALTFTKTCSLIVPVFARNDACQCTVLQSECAQKV